MRSIAMLNRILSHDLPRSRWLALALVAILVGLALAPFIFPGSKALGVAAKMLVFIVLVASYDLLLGYTGIVSFAHTMFFGIGAYGIAVASTALGAGWQAVGVGLAAELAISIALSLLIGLFSLRVKAIFYAMITLAVASAFQTLASQLSDFTGGEDGLSFRNPAWLSPSSPPVMSDSCEARVWNAAATAKVIIAKKIAFTRRLNRPISSDSSSEATSATAMPFASAPQEVPRRVLAMATPYAPMPKNMVCAKLTMPV